MLKFIKALIKRRKRNEEQIKTIVLNDMTIYLNKKEGVMKILTKRDLTQEEIEQILREYL